MGIRRVSQVVALQALLLTACWIGPSIAAGADQVETRPIDGHRFSEGQTFRFICKAIGSQDYAVRLLCPLSVNAPGTLASPACFENCGRPLCNQPALNDCAKTMPELLNTDCTRRVSQLSGDTQEITVEYVFRSPSVRNKGLYTCQYKNMRSGVKLTIDATTTTSTTTSTTTATTAAVRPATTTSSTTSTITTTATTPKPMTPTTKFRAPVPSTVLGTTLRATDSVSTSRAPGGRFVTTRPIPHTNKSPNVKTNGGEVSVRPWPELEDGDSATIPRSEDEVQLKSAGGWFYSSLAGKLVGIDIVLIVLLLVLAAVLVGGYLFIRCQVLARQKASEASTKRPMQSCCATLLCIGNDQASGTSSSGRSGVKGNGTKKVNGYQTKSGRPPIQAYPSVIGSDSASGQVYSEAILDSSVYGQSEFDRLAGGGGDAYYRLQTHFAEAEPRLLVGGSQRGPHGGGGFFARDAPDRHSFHNVRAARQRPAIPADLLLSGGGGGEGGTSELNREEIRGQVEQQRREIEQLRLQLRDSQLQLTRIVSSQQDLHRSVSFSRMAAVRGGAGTGAASAATTPDGGPGAAPGDEYDFLTKTTTPTSTELPAFATSVTGGSGGGDGIGSFGGGLRASADLLLSIDEPIEEEEDSADQIEYPTVKSNRRRSSIGEAYGTGRH